MPSTPRTPRGLLRWLSLTDAPVFVLDARRVVLFFNRGCEQATGWTAADVIGKVCEFATDSNPQSPASVTTRLCPPAHVFEGRNDAVAVSLMHRDGGTRAGAIHFFPLPTSADGTLHVLGVFREGATAFDPTDRPSETARELHRSLAILQDELHRRYGDDSLIGESDAIGRLHAQIRAAAASTAAVHLCGPAGSGKQHVARMIHRRSQTPQRAFVPLDCRRMPAFELKRTLRRLLEESVAPLTSGDGPQVSAVYLQHVGQLPRDLQDEVVKFYADSDPRRQRLRLFTSEERPLESLLDHGLLLPKFYFLISELVLAVPPLAARREDIPLLSQSLLEQFNVRDARQVDGLAADASQLIHRYNWPGNVAELQLVLREARQVCRTHLITAADLPFRFRTGLDAQSVGPALTPDPVALEDLLAQVEEDYIRWALAQAKGNKTGAAALLGLTRPRLYRRMEALGIEDPAEPPGNVSPA